MTAKAKASWFVRRSWSDADYIAHWRSTSTVDANGCWIAAGRQSRSKGRPIGSPGYVQAFYRGKRYQMTRLVYTLLVGPIPDGHVVAHRCDNPPCFNPDHLFAATEQVNMLDAGAKRRWPRQYRDTCAQGHPRTPENAVRFGKLQKLNCRACLRLRYIKAKEKGLTAARQRRRRARLKAERAQVRTTVG